MESTLIFTILIRTRQNSPFPLELMCVLGFCVGISLFIRGFKLLQRRRLILDTPASKIRSASLGMVEISGLATGPHTMVAPITERDCYYFRTIVWEWKKQGKDSQWVKVAGECMHVPFFVDDNTGQMLVDPRGADLELHRDFCQEFNGSFFSMSDGAPANVVQFLARHGVATSNKIKVEEYCIKPKNALFILGTLTENPGIVVTSEPLQDEQPISSFRPQGFSLSFSMTREFQTGSPMARAETRFEAPMPHPVQLVPKATPAGAQQEKVTAALVRAGITNKAAWAAAGVSAVGGAGVRASVTQITAGSANNISGGGSRFDLRPPVVLMKGTNDKTFLISWRSQQEVARSLGWKCTSMIWGGPPLALLSLYVLLATLKLL